MHAEASRAAPAADPFTRLSSDLASAILERLDFSDGRAVVRSTAVPAVSPGSLSAACAVHIPGESQEHWRVLRMRAGCVSRALRATVHGEDSDLLERPVVPASHVTNIAAASQWLLAHGERMHSVTFDCKVCRERFRQAQDCAQEVVFPARFAGTDSCIAALPPRSGPLSGSRRCLSLHMCLCYPHP